MGLQAARPSVGRAAIGRDAEIAVGETEVGGQEDIVDTQVPPTCNPITRIHF